MSPSTTPKPAFAWILFALWLATCGGLFWNGFLSGIFARPPVVLSTFPAGPLAKSEFEHWVGTRSEKALPGAMILLVRNPGCPCDRLIADQVRSIKREAGQRSIPVHEIVPAQTAALPESPDAAWRVDPARLRAWVSAGPAIMILGAQGTVTYAGPLAATGLCGDDTSKQNLMRYTQSGTSSNPVMPLGIGCFCPIKTDT